jgi:hypothetical protein
VQMTMVVPCRLMTRHRSHMGLTDALTFMRTKPRRAGAVKEFRAHTETPCGAGSS